MTETYGYDAFGTLTNIQRLNENGVLAEVETALSRFLYASEQLDNTTGLYYLRARQYDTETGRFTQEDTYLGDGRNLYVYVSNNPLKYADPSGHEATKSIRDKVNAPYIEMNTDALENLDDYIARKDAWENSYNGKLQNSIENDPVGSAKDFLIGFTDKILELLTSDLVDGPGLDSVQHYEVFNEGQESGTITYLYMAYQFGAFGSQGNYGNASYGSSNSTQIVVPGNDGMPIVIGQVFLPSNVTNLGNQSIAVFPSIDVEGNQSIGNWDMPEGGVIDGREYSQHALERMAPDTLQVRAELSRRAEMVAEQLGYKVGTRQYYQFLEIYVNPRNIPPSVVENAIASTEAVPGNQPGTFVHETEDIKVIVNSDGKVITVIPK